jgi:uncharacterized coiled-coil DUF342 family protein
LKREKDEIEIEIDELKTKRAEFNDRISDVTDKVDLIKRRKKFI